MVVQALAGRVRSLIISKRHTQSLDEGARPRSSSSSAKRPAAEGRLKDCLSDSRWPKRNSKSPDEQQQHREREPPSLARGQHGRAATCQGTKRSQDLHLLVSFVMAFNWLRSLLLASRIRPVAAWLRGRRARSLANGRLGESLGGLVSDEA